ncbi:lycopene cyclase domain-containing protein [Natronolimnobius sp. AArcel1]|uniref:lycopene cyclase domain-containing protein n=1 Tax=Natronolimnobius sp. AArcel1 TaxID=1679093 RepID=UPI0013EC9FD0|nr:lycopene cyclase domain-containing protein [Natronolimnobius sp. AArcel1]NGM67667.1 lycopene cyclase domain-containing protein [Natronolimnobius sp. AArcel1]
MTVPLSYLEFHVLFILPPIAFLAWLAIRREDAWWGRDPLSAVAIVCALALVYTTPWDNLLIAEGVWWYGDGAVAATIWHAPLGEYLFFVLQPVLTAFWLFQWPQIADRSLALPRSHRVLGASAGVAVSLFGYLLLSLETQSTIYLGAIFLWAGPILAIQWGFGLSYLWEVRWTVAIGIAVPTLYLWVADRIAIGLGIWQISEVHTIGYDLFGLPIEEAVFFLVTNIFVVQTVVLYLWLLERRHELPELVPVPARFQNSHPTAEVDRDDS